MTSNISGRTLAFIFTSTILVSCVNHNLDKMTEAESDHIVKDLKSFFDKITQFSEGAQLGSFLSCYDSSPTFLHFSSDGKMRNYEELKKVCTEYYNTLKEQKIIIIQEKFHVMDTNLG